MPPTIGSTPRSLFVKRPLVNAKDFIVWAKGQGFKTVLPESDLHCTIIYSKTPLTWPKPLDNQLTVTGGFRVVDSLGDQGAVALTFESRPLTERWQELLAAGARSDYPSFTGHVTITWQAGDLDLSKVKPYLGPLVFGPERFKEIDPNWSPDSIMEKTGARHSAADRGVIQNMHDQSVQLGATCNDGDEPAAKRHGEKIVAKVSNTGTARVLKVDDGLGLVFGWAIICKHNGVDYFDVQGDNIPEASMLKASTEFMLSERTAKEMHFGKGKGTIAFAFPLTEDIAKAMGVTTEQTGLMIAMKPDSPELLAKFRSGPNGESPEYTGFSIGGGRVVDEAVE